MSNLSDHGIQYFNEEQPAPVMPRVGFFKNIFARSTRGDSEPGRPESTGVDTNNQDSQ